MDDIKGARVSKGMSQKELASKANVSVSTLKRMKTRKGVSDVMMSKVAIALDLNPDDVLASKSDPAVVDVDFVTIMRTVETAKTSAYETRPFLSRSMLAVFFVWGAASILTSLAHMFFRDHHLWLVGLLSTGALLIYAYWVGRWADRVRFREREKIMPDARTVLEGIRTGRLGYIMPRHAERLEALCGDEFLHAANAPSSRLTSSGKAD